MTDPAVLVETLRGGLMENRHMGHALILTGDGEVVESWGDPDRVTFPRSSCKMVQALPLVESGAADAAGLGSEELALACASHQGQPMHTDRVAAWLDQMHIPQDAFCCGPQMPRDPADRDLMIKTDGTPCPIHNNCSGKHAGFLTLAKHMQVDLADYVNPDHPVQLAVRDATEETAQESVSGMGIDGCSAPNFALTLMGLGRQMAAFTRAPRDSGLRARAMTRLTNAMRAHPELVGGDGRACTELMHAMNGNGAIKVGADGVYIAILPELDRAIALKIDSGDRVACECAIAALLVRVGALDYDHPMTRKRLDTPLRNWDGLEVGLIRAADSVR